MPHEGGRVLHVCKDVHKAIAKATAEKGNVALSATYIVWSWMQV